MSVRITAEELKAVNQKLFDGKKRVQNGNKIAYVHKMVRAVDSRRPGHISEKNWETLSYTTRLQLIETEELKQLKAQQWELYRKLRDEAAKSSS